jgi:hypothetical protein
MTGDLWIYRPESHKTAYRGHVREIPLGPRAQEVLRPWLRSDLDAYLFSPSDAEAQRNARRRAERKSPMTPSQAKRHRTRNPKRRPGTRYTVFSYRRAIVRGCDAAFAPPADLWQRPEELREWRRAHRWSPHALRHNYGTAVRREFGLEAAKAALGHRTVTATQIYAEQDRNSVAAVARKIG